MWKEIMRFNLANFPIDGFDASFLLPGMHALVFFENSRNAVGLSAQLFDFFVQQQ